jgi:hypothetical protein
MTTSVDTPPCRAAGWSRGWPALVSEAVEVGEVQDATPDVLADTLYVTYNGALVSWAIDGHGSLTRGWRSGWIVFSHPMWRDVSDVARSGRFDRAAAG